MKDLNFTISQDQLTGEEQHILNTTPVVVPEEEGAHKLTVVFTGHRAILKTWCEDYTNMTRQPMWGNVLHALERFGEWIKGKGYEPKDVRFVNGGALGFDLAAVYGLILPWQRMGAHYTLALPWPGYWNPKWNYRPAIANQIRHAYDVADTYLYAQTYDDGQWAKALNARNHVMVDQMGEGDVLVGCWSGTRRGGTWNCLNYAKQKYEGLFGVKYQVITFHPITGKWSNFLKEE
jgi:hypothetical protein